MADIGQPEKIIEVEPVVVPERTKPVEPSAPVPEREPEKVPA